MMRIALVVSLVINVLVVSLLAVGGARLWSGRHNGHDHYFQRLADALPPADGELLRDAVSRHRPEVREARRGYEAATQRVSTIAAATQLDEAALKEALAQLKASRIALLELRLRIFAEVVVTMSQAGRARLLTADQ